MVLKRIAKLFPFFDRTVRISEIRCFVEDEVNVADGRIFSHLITEYKLVEGIPPEELKQIKIHVLHNHILKLFEDCEYKLNAMSDGKHLGGQTYATETRTTLLDWLSSTNGHYDTEESFQRLSETLETYTDGLTEYASDKLISGVRRNIVSISITMKYLVAALAKHKYGMEFEDW